MERTGRYCHRLLLHEPRRGQDPRPVGRPGPQRLSRLLRCPAEGGRLAKRAGHAAARLSGDADGLPPRFRNVHALDGGAVIEPVERLDRAVGRKLPVHDLGAAKIVLFGEGGPHTSAPTEWLG